MDLLDRNLMVRCSYSLGISVSSLYLWTNCGKKQEKTQHYYACLFSTSLFLAQVETELHLFQMGAPVADRVRLSYLQAM
jgi:hypothetical protein